MPSKNVLLIPLSWSKVLKIVINQNFARVYRSEGLFCSMLSDPITVVICYYFHIFLEIEFDFIFHKRYRSVMISPEQTVQTDLAFKFDF